MSEICCADKDPVASPERCVWETRQEIKAGTFVLTPWTGECSGMCGEFPCTCACKCDPLTPNSHCYCDCDGCGCSNAVSWRSPRRLEDLSGRNPDGE